MGEPMLIQYTSASDLYIYKGDIVYKDGWPRKGVIDEWFEGALESAYACRYPNLMAVFQDGVARFGDEEIFVFPTLGERYTRKRLDEAIRKVAASLITDHGVEKGDRVAMILLNNP